jgi:hypothetical protein
MPWAKRLLVVIAGLLLAGAANATSISYFLDQTNTQTTNPTGSAYDPDNALPDGTNYLQVTLADSGSDIVVTVDVLSPPFSSSPIVEDANFGIQNFYFNSTNSALLASEITVPSGWDASIDFNPSNPNQNADGFGAFEVRVADTGMNRKNPTLSFTISSDGDSINDYVEALLGGSEGAFFFAAHVTGFADQNSLAPADDPFDGVGLCYDMGGGNFTPECNFLTSTWLGGSTPVPEPSTALLLLGGLSGLAVWRRRRLH